jgi:O-antigen/teichoic acid export membrane protein
MLYSASGPIVIGALVDARSAGAYSVMERAVIAISGAAMLTHTAAYPRLAATYARDRAAYRNILKLVLLTYLAVSAAIAIAVIALRDDVVQFLYHEQSESHYTLLYLGLVWLLLGVLCSALTCYLTVSGRTREVWPLTLKILVTAVAIGIPAVLLCGGAGWLLALVLSQAIVLASGFKYWRREYAR